MGVYLSKAKTEKCSEYGGTVDEDNTRYGLTSMQGWRQTMEDSHLAIPRVRELESVVGREVGLYGVFDGHGGPAVSAWISKHMIRVLEEEMWQIKKSLSEDRGEGGKEMGSSVSSSDENTQNFDDFVVLLSESLCKTFIGLDEEMQKPEHLEELKLINDDLQAKNAADDQDNDDDSGTGNTAGTEQSTIKSLLSNQPRLIQAFLNNSRPVIKLVEQDGEQFISISTSKPDETSHDEDQHAAKPNATVEEIVEDSHVTAPEVKSPRLAKTVVNEQKQEHLQVKEEGDQQIPPSPTTAMVNTAVKHLNDAAHDTETASDGTSPATNEASDSDEIPASQLHPQLSVEATQIGTGIPETCGAAVVVCAVIGGDKPMLVTANAGDSRCVLCRKGVAIAQSHDHKPYLLQEHNRIYKAGGTIEHGRVDGNLNLSRTLGDLFYKRNKALKPEEQKITAYPDIIITPITPLDEFVIVACDGIWDCLTNQAACDFVSSRLGDNPTPEHLSKICEEMCDACLAGHPMESEGGIGCDNMTCIIVLLNDKFKSRGTTGEASTTYYKKSSCAAE